MRFEKTEVYNFEGNKYEFSSIQTYQQNKW